MIRNAAGEVRFVLQGRIPLSPVCIHRLLFRMSYFLYIYIQMTYTNIMIFQFVVNNVF